MLESKALSEQEVQRLSMRLIFIGRYVDKFLLSTNKGAYS